MWIIWKCESYISVLYFVCLIYKLLLGNSSEVFPWNILFCSMPYVYIFFQHCDKVFSRYVLSFRDPVSCPSEIHLVCLVILRLPDGLPLTLRVTHFSPFSLPTCSQLLPNLSSSAKGWQRETELATPAFSSLPCLTCPVSSHTFHLYIFSDRKKNHIPIRRGAREIQFQWPTSDEVRMLLCGLFVLPVIIFFTAVT